MIASFNNEVTSLIDWSLNTGDTHTALTMVDVMRNGFIDGINRSISGVSTYKLQRGGVSGTTLNTFKKNSDSLQLETLARLYCKVNEIK